MRGNTKTPRGVKRLTLAIWSGTLVAFMFWGVMGVIAAMVAGVGSMFGSSPRLDLLAAVPVCAVIGAVWAVAIWLFADWRTDTERLVVAATTTAPVPDGDPLNQNELNLIAKKFNCDVESISGRRCQRFMLHRFILGMDGDHRHDGFSWPVGPEDFNRNVAHSEYMRGRAESFYCNDWHGHVSGAYHPDCPCVLCRQRHG